MTIKNESKINDKEVLDLRASIEHRATWFYLLLDEARKEGLDWDSFARRAITKCGCFHGKTRFDKVKSPEDFAKALVSDTVKTTLEAKVTEVEDNKAVIQFHYCPLVAAWQKLTDNEEDIDKLCDIAMDGDRGIISTLENFKINIEKTIAQGADFCQVVVEKVTSSF